MESLVIQILNEVCAALWQLRLKRGRHILTAEEENHVIGIVNCIIAAGWEPHIGAKPPKGNLLTPRDMMNDISRVLKILTEWDEMLSAQQVFDSLTKREKQLFELLALNTNAEVEAITGLKYNYIKTVRTRINYKTNCNSPKSLRDFYYKLLHAGVNFKPWTAKMKKKIGVS